MYLPQSSNPTQLSHSPQYSVYGAFLIAQLSSGSRHQIWSAQLSKETSVIKFGQLNYPKKPVIKFGQLNYPKTPVIKFGQLKRAKKSIINFGVLNYPKKCSFMVSSTILINHSLNSVLNIIVCICW
jgi:hypothetical protein